MSNNIPDQLRLLPLTKVAEFIAKLAVYNSLEKTSADVADGINKVVSYFKDKPALNNAAIGATLGSLGYGGSTFLRNRFRRPEEQESILHNALLGGAAGTAVGGGIGLLRSGIASPTAAGAAAKPVVIEHNGQKIELDSSAASNPAIKGYIDKAKETSLARTLGSASGDAYDFLKDNAPWSSTLAGIRGAYDVMRHAPLLRTSFLGGQIDAEKVRGRAALGPLLSGIAAMKTEAVPGFKDLMKGTYADIARMLPSSVSSDPKKLSDAIKRIIPDEAVREAVIRNPRMSLTEAIAKHAPSEGSLWQRMRTSFDSAKSSLQSSLNQRAGSTLVGMPEKGLGDYKPNMSLKPMFNAGDRATILATTASGANAPRAYRNPITGNSYFGRSMGRNIGSRVFSYGAPIAVEAIIRSALNSKTDNLQAESILRNLTQTQKNMQEAAANQPK